VGDAAAGLALEVGERKCGIEGGWGEGNGCCCEGVEW